MDKPLHPSAEPTPPAPDPDRRARNLVVAAMLAYTGLSLYSASVPDARGLGAALSVGPLAAIAVLLAWRWLGRWPAVLVALATGAGMVHYWDAIRSLYRWSDLVQQCGLYGLAALLFALSLQGGREPLCVQLARTLHADFSARELAYLRGATAAWAVFFLALAIAVGVLFFTLSQAHWSLFTNVGAVLLMAAMTLADLGLRHALLPRHRSGGLLAALRTALLG